MFRLRSRSSIRPLQAATVLALVALAGCQASVPSMGAPQPTVDAAAPTVPTTDVVPQTTATDVVAADAATAVLPTLVPTPRPTPRPLPTPIAPGQALDPATTALETKLTAFRGALKTQDVNGALRLQRELLTSASYAESAIKNDTAPHAQSVRTPIPHIPPGIASTHNG